MSADNVIYIRNIDNKWWVWESCLSANQFEPDKKKDIYFETEKEAEKYAIKLFDNINYVEYGIVMLPPG